MPLISIVLPTWNNAACSIQCIASVLAHSRHDVHFIWIDNGSDDENHALVLDALKGAHWSGERHDRPMGFARAVNRGLSHVRGDYVAFLNNDLRVVEGWDTELVNAVQDLPGIAGPLSIGPLGWQNVARHPWIGQAPFAKGADAVAGWLRANWEGKAIELPENPTLPMFERMLAFFCVMMPASVQRHIGLLDENFGWGYCEDDDYCLRARELGYSLTLCPGAVVHHDGGQTMLNLGPEGREGLDRNLAYLAEKHGLEAR